MDRRTDIWKACWGVPSPFRHADAIQQGMESRCDWDKDSSNPRLRRPPFFPHPGDDDRQRPALEVAWRHWSCGHGLALRPRENEYGCHSLDTTVDRSCQLANGSTLGACAHDWTAAAVLVPAASAQSACQPSAPGRASPRRSQHVLISRGAPGVRPSPISNLAQSAALASTLDSLNIRLRLRSLPCGRRAQGTPHAAPLDNRLGPERPWPRGCRTSGRGPARHYGPWPDCGHLPAKLTGERLCRQSRKRTLKAEAPATDDLRQFSQLPYNRAHLLHWQRGRCR